MATVSKTFRSGSTLSYDDADLHEKRAEDLGHIHPSVEFWITNNASTIDNALVVGAGFGLFTDLLNSEGVTVTSVEPNSSRFSLLETNVTTGTNINKAVSSTSGTGTLHFFDDNKSQSVLGENIGTNAEEVDVITVDSLDLTLDLLIVFASGKELDVLDGASDTMTNNPNMKIIIRWIPDLLNDVDAAITKLQSYGKDISIIHWEEEGDAISYKSQFTSDYPDDSLKAVGVADLLLE
jgi:FkbM family methyltransferase